MKECIFQILENRPVSNRVHLLRLSGDTSAITAPGQFLSLSLPGKFLRRPFSVCDWDDGWVSLLVECVGTGTELLQMMPVGAELSVLTGLGNGFTMNHSITSPLLIGGGTGLSPLVGLAKRLSSAGISPDILLGFRNRDDSFGADLFTGLNVRICEDVFDVLPHIHHNMFYACGSEALMLELCRRDSSDGQVAFDVRMGCGFGVCMGCSRKTRSGMKRVCKDGPVFQKGDLIWED